MERREPAPIMPQVESRVTFGNAWAVGGGHSRRRDDTRIDDSRDSPDVP